MTSALKSASRIPVALALSAGLAAAPASQNAPPVPQQRFLSGTDVVLVDVLVTRGGQPLSGLTASDFTVRDNGVEQSVRLVDLVDLPVGLLFVLDTSGSVNGAPLDHLKAAARTALGNLRPTDQAALMVFSHSLVLAGGWTADRDQMARAIDGVTASGATALSDAAFAALALGRPAGLRTLLLFFSDGDDTASWLPAPVAVEAARRSDAVIYAVDADTAGARTPAPVPDLSARLLEQPSLYRDALLPVLAQETGGEWIRAADAASLQKVFGDAVARFNQRYVLAYTPAGVPLAGWHDLLVNVAGDDLTVIARRGYRRD